MANLYELINQKYGGKAVGDAYANQKKIYEGLGSPMGGYTGSANQNNWLLSNQNKWDTGYGGTTAPTATAQTTTNSIVDNAVNSVGGNNVQKNPVFGEVLPFENAWDQLKGMAGQEAFAQISPELKRQLNASLSNYYKGLAGRGGGRFGFGGAGSLDAAAQRDLAAQTADWVNQKKEGFKNLWYDPSEKAYNKGLETSATPTTPTVPTWAEFMTKNYSGSQIPNTNAPLDTNIMTGGITDPYTDYTNRQSNVHPLEGTGGQYDNAYSQGMIPDGRGGFFTDGSMTRHVDANGNVTINEPRNVTGGLKSWGGITNPVNPNMPVPVNNFTGINYTTPGSPVQTQQYYNQMLNY